MSIFYFFGGTDLISMPLGAIASEADKKLLFQQQGRSK
jgi:hypothetical protein